MINTIFKIIIQGVNTTNKNYFTISKELNTPKDFIAKLMPEPNQFRYLESSAEILRYPQIILQNLSENEYIIEDLIKELNGLGFIVNENIDIIEQASNEEQYLLNNVKNSRESYILHISEHSISISGKDPHGIFYGIQTLLQILSMGIEQQGSEKPILIPCYEIIDYPILKIRGITDDITRGQTPTVQSVKNYIYLMSKFKLNSYGIGYEQDFFKFSKYPVLVDYKEGLNADEIKEIDTYAKKRFVDLFPIYTCFGHQDNLLLKDEYKDWGEFPGSQCFNIADNRMYDMLEAHIKELSEVFSSKTFHMGCDESFDLGLLRSNKYLKEQGKGPALLNHYTKVYNIIKKYGKENIIIYHDIVFHYKEELKSAPKDLILMYWDYLPKKKYKTVYDLAKSNMPIIVSASHLNWCRHFPDIKNATLNLIQITEDAKQITNSEEYKSSKILGQLNSIWGDFANTNLRENNIYDTLLTSAVSWSHAKIDGKKKLIDLTYHLFGLQSFAIAEELGTNIWKLAELNRLIMKPGFISPIFYLQLFRHPFYSEDKRKFIKNPKKLKLVAEEIKKQLLKLNKMGEIHNNGGFIDYLLYSVDIAILMAQKELMRQEFYNIWIEKIRINKVINKEYYQDKIILAISEFIEKAEVSKELYEKLWMNCAKRPVLDHNLGRFENLIRYCKEKIIDIKNGIYYRSPFIQSQWITFKKYKNPPNGLFFRKIFNLETIPEKSRLLIMAGDYCKFYINGKYIDDVTSRLSLSFVPIKERIKLYDIKAFLQKGKNLIAVEAYNYEKIYPCINVLIRNQFNHKDEKDTIGNRTIKINEIRSDKSWKVFVGYNPDNKDLKYKSPDKKDSPINSNWNSSLSNDELYEKFDWHDVDSLGAPPKYNLHIYNEDILNDVVPYTEDYFGFESHTIGVLKTTVGNWLAVIAKPLLKLVKKILKLS